MELVRGLSPPPRKKTIKDRVSPPPDFWNRQENLRGIYLTKWSFNSRVRKYEPAQFSPFFPRFPSFIPIFSTPSPLFSPILLFAFFIFNFFFPTDIFSHFPGWGNFEKYISLVNVPLFSVLLNFVLLYPHHSLIFLLYPHFSFHFILGFLSFLDVFWYTIR